jgi:hypothetical protein
VWTFQVKRWKEVGPKAVRTFVEEAVVPGEVVPYKIVVAIACRASNDTIKEFHRAAAEAGFRDSELWTRDTLYDLLGKNRNARIAARFFGDGPALEGTVRVPLSLERGGGRDIVLRGRADERARIQSSTVDLIVYGRPGTGKTRLASEVMGARFLRRGASANDIADSLRLREPAGVVVDDAGLDLDAIELLQELRHEGHDFRIIATTWPESLTAVRRELPGADEVELSELERHAMDEIVLSMGVSNYYVRGRILQQSEGRPGWAVTLVEIAKGGDVSAAVSGRAVLAEVESYLKRLGVRDSALGYIAVLAAVGPLDRAGLDHVRTLLSLDVPAADDYIRIAAAAGVLDTTGGVYRIAPDPLRHALVAHWFFERPGASSVDALLAALPLRSEAVIATLIEGARIGSDGARAEVDKHLPTGTEVPALAEDYASLDERASRRVVINIERLGEPWRHRVLRASVSTFALPEAVRILLDDAVGDSRPQHPHPDHPVRVLGEAGSRVDPHGSTTFPLRESILRVANEWLEEDPSPARQLVWSDVIVRLLDPTVEGNYQDLGSPRTIHLADGIEGVEHLRMIARNLWPEVASRLALLAGPAIARIAPLLDEWTRLARGWAGRRGSRPDHEVTEVAAAFQEELIERLTAAALGHPWAQAALQRSVELYHIRLPQRVDPECRVLSWRPWDFKHGRSAHMSHAVGRVVDRWLVEPASALMGRLSQSLAAAAAASVPVEMLPMAMRDYAARTTDVEGAMRAAIDAGFTWQVGPLMARSLAEATDLPDWFEPALAGPQRAALLEVALREAKNRAAAERAIESLDARDVMTVEAVALSRAANDHDWVCLALLRHPVPEVRGTASLWYGLDATDQAPRLPDDWYDVWKDAFLVAPVLDGRGQEEYRVGEQMKRLVTRDPDLAERWVDGLLTGPDVRLYRLPDEVERAISRLPDAARDRLLRGHATNRHLLALLMSDDSNWLQPPLADGVVSAEDVLHALAWDIDNGEQRLPGKARKLLGHASVLLAAGLAPEAVASVMRFGTSFGEDSEVAESIRLAFESVQAPDDDGEKVRQAGIALMTRLRDGARVEDRRRRVRGEL